MSTGPECGAVYRFEGRLKTHPREVVLMRVTGERAEVQDLQSRERWVVTRLFFDRYYVRATRRC